MDKEVCAMKRTFFLLALAWCLIWSGCESWAQDGDIFVVISGRKISNVVVVAKSGGQYKSIQDAVDSITDATGVNPYLIVVGPGWYTESVMLKPYVHLQGAGKDLTYIRGSNGYGAFQATVVLDDQTSVSDLTIVNDGTWHSNVALLAPRGTNSAVVTDVNAYYIGLASGGVNDYGIYVNDGSIVTLNNVKAIGQRGTDLNYGLYVNDATVKLNGGTFIGRHGEGAQGICNRSGRLSAIGITTMAENATLTNYGLTTYGESAESNITQSVLEGDALSLCRFNGTVIVTHTRLIGPVSCVPCTCVGVSEGTTFYTNTCPPPP